MIKIYLSLVVLFGCLLFPSITFATSGCCSSHGGVNCAAGPQANGKVICNDGNRNSSCLYSEMVKCGGSSTGGTTTTQPATYVAPAATSNPTIAPTIKPTPKPTMVPSPIPTPSPRPSPSPTPSPTPVPTPVPTPSPSPLPSPTPENSPEVAGATDEIPEEPQAQPLDESSEGNPVLGVGVLGATGAGAYMVFGKKKKVGEKVIE